MLNESLYDNTALIKPNLDQDVDNEHINYEFTFQVNHYIT